MNKKHAVEIPEIYLLVLATYGSLGSGKVPKLMQAWATSECERLGLHDQFVALQRRNLVELRERLKNTLGQESVDYIDSAISKWMETVS